MFDVRKAIVSVPSVVYFWSGSGLDKVLPQIFKDLISKSNGTAGINFLKLPTKLLNFIGEFKVPEQLRPYFFGAKLIVLVKIDARLQLIAFGMLRRIAC